MTLLAPTMQVWFTDRMINQKNASPRTICAYRDTMRLLLTFATETTGTPPSRLDIEQLDAPLRRAASPRAHAHDRARDRDPQQDPRARDNLPSRTTGDQSAARRAGPQHLARASRSRAAADRDPDRTARLRTLRRADRPRPARGRREHPGRRETTQQRVTPLTPGTVKVLKVWLRERQGNEDDPLFPTRQGGPLSPKAIAWLLDKHTTTAAAHCASLKKKRVTPHVLRHTNATLVLTKNDIATVALWLGHESTKSTEIYLHSVTTIKQDAIDKIASIDTPPGRYKPSDKLLAFLESL